MNSQRTVLETAALPIELHPCIPLQRGVLLSTVPAHDFATAVLIVPHTGTFEISGKQAPDRTTNAHWIHLRDFIIWCLRTGSNCRRPALQAGALPTELPRHYWSTRLDLNQRYYRSCSPTLSTTQARVQMAGMAGFEPANVGVKGRCLTAWRHPNIGTPDGT